MSDAASITDQDLHSGWDVRTLIGYTGGPLLIEGPAGSGKTRLLVDRFRWFIEQGAMPDSLALVVPSRGRANAVRAALEEALREGYGELHVVTPVELAAAVLRRAGRPGMLEMRLGPGERVAMLAERIDELPLHHHDFGGNAGGMLARLVRRIDALKAQLIGAEDFIAGLDDDCDPREREFGEILRFHDQMLREASACDDGELTFLALRLLREAPVSRSPFEHVLVDDAHELGPATAALARTVAGSRLTVAGDRLLGDLAHFEAVGPRVARLLDSHRCPPSVFAAAWALALGTEAATPEHPVGVPAGAGVDHGGVSFWRCSNERAQAQQVAAEIERLLAREDVSPGRIAVLVPDVTGVGQAISVALEERAVPHRIVGDVAFFQRAEIRDLLAWLRLLADPGDAPAVVRALARAPIELRSVDIARCTQIARRRRLDMVEALAAATESPQVPPEARERIRVFLKLYRACVAQVDTMRPDLYVHRLIERLGLRRQQLFAAQTDVVERLRALARFGELAAAHVGRKPQATAREFARAIAAVAEYGLPERDEPDLSPDPALVQVLGFDCAAGLEVDYAFVVGLRASLLSDSAAQEGERDLHLRRSLYQALTRARGHVVLAYPASGEHGAAVAPLELVELARRAADARWEDRDEELFGPAETLHATYQLLRDELLEGTVRTGGRLAELRFDTDLDVSHAVVRYLELLKVSALITRDDGQTLADALRDVNARISQAITAEQREIFSSSPLDDYLLDAERDARRRTQVIAARDEPSLERFLPMRGDGVLLSATDIDTYRSCPLKYKFARVFRIPQEPTLHQRFGIVVHQVLERYHASGEQLGPLAELLGLLEQCWRRGGFGDSEEERQLRSKATTALTLYHDRAREQEARPVWFERQFNFRIGPHLVRGRVDRVDRLPGGEYELIDYKTGRPKTAEQLVDDVQLSLYAIGAREAWGLEASRGAYYYLLDDEKVAVPGDPERADWIRQVAVEVADGIRSQEFEPTPSATACGLCDYRLLCPAAER